MIYRFQRWFRERKRFTKEEKAIPLLIAKTFSSNCLSSFEIFEDWKYIVFEQTKKFLEILSVISLKQKFLPSYFILKILKFVIILQTDYSVILLLVYSIKKKITWEKFKYSNRPRHQEQTEYRSRVRSRLRSYRADTPGRKRMTHFREDPNADNTSHSPESRILQGGNKGERGGGRRKKGGEIETSLLSARGGGRWKRRALLWADRVRHNDQCRVARGEALNGGLGSILAGLWDLERWATEDRQHRLRPRWL